MKIPKLRRSLFKKPKGLDIARSGLLKTFLNSLSEREEAERMALLPAKVLANTVASA